MANINVGAVLLTGIVIIGGTLIGGIGRLINGGNFIEINGNNIPWLKTGNKKQKGELRKLLFFFGKLALIFLWLVHF
jgi:hypothetical protein